MQSVALWDGRITASGSRSVTNPARHGFTPGRYGACSEPPPRVLEAGLQSNAVGILLYVWHRCAHEDIPLIFESISFEIQLTFATLIFGKVCVFDFPLIPGVAVIAVVHSGRRFYIAAHRESIISSSHPSDGSSMYAVQIRTQQTAYSRPTLPQIHPPPWRARYSGPTTHTHVPISSSNLCRPDVEMHRTWA